MLPQVKVLVSLLLKHLCFFAVGMQIGYPVLQHPQMHVQGHHTHIAAATAMSSCHVVVNGVPAPPHLQPFIEDELNQ